MNLQNKQKRLIIFLGSFVFFFISGAIFWYTLIDGHLYYCTDKTPLIDLIPPFVHGSQVGDYYIASPVIVYLLWTVLLFLIIFLPFVLAKNIKEVIFSKIT